MRCNRAATVFLRTLILTTMLTAAVFNYGANTASAASLTLSTPFPGISAAPGETVTFPLTLKNDGLAPQNFSLQVTAAPDGWKHLIRGRGKTVHEVFVATDDDEFFDIEIQIPEQAKAETYRFEVRAASSGGISSTLPLSVRVDEKGSASAELVAQYPALQGPSDASFTFRVDLKNNGPEERMYSLSAQAPEGWQVSFKPSFQDNQIASLSVNAGGSQGLDVNIKPPANAEAGTYPIVVQANSSSANAKAELTVEITGRYELKLGTESGRLNARTTAGKESPTQLILLNSGSADLQDVKLTSSIPSNWEARFEPEVIPVLAAGETAQVTLYLKPDAQSIAGDYAMSVTAQSATARDRIDIRVAVATSTLWGWVGIGLVALVAIGVGGVFRVYGRR